MTRSTRNGRRLLALFALILSAGALSACNSSKLNGLVGGGSKADKSTVTLTGAAQ